MSRAPLSEDELHAYADHRLNTARRADVEAMLAQRPELRQAVADWRMHKAQLHTTYDSVLSEPLPARLLGTARVPRRHTPLRFAAVVTWLVLGGIIGFTLRGQLGQDAPSSLHSAHLAALPRQAAIAHAVFSPEVRHPVEVGASEETHLVAWLSKRLGTALKPPHLAAQGFDLVGGRLLPGEAGPVAQFMYQDSQGQRLTLYVRQDAAQNAPTAFRYAQEGKVSVFYWLDGKMGYALSGEMNKGTLLPVATAVYQQMNP